MKEGEKKLHELFSEKLRQIRRARTIYKNLNSHSGPVSIFIDEAPIRKEANNDL